MLFVGIDSTFEEPIFNSAHEALTFAFRHTNWSPSTPFKSLVVSKPEEDEKYQKTSNMGVLTVSEVAGSVLFHACQLMTTEKMAIIGRFCRRTKPTQKIMKRELKTRKVKLKSGVIREETYEKFTQVNSPNALTDEFIKACETLANHPKIREKSDDEMIRKVLVAKYFGEKQNLKELAEQLNVSYRWGIKEVNRQIRPILNEIEDRAWSLISEKLKERGFYK